MRAGQYAYRDRRNRKRVFRRLWIARINAAVARAWDDLQPVHRGPASRPHRPDRKCWPTWPFATNRPSLRLLSRSVVMPVKPSGQAAA
jgi:hypothetical protein